MADHEDCIFCRIAAGELGTPFLIETDSVVAFDDLAPQAPTHVLIVPKRHVPSIAVLTRDHDALLGELVDVANRVAEQREIAETGFRLLTNAGPDAGQTVFHMHWHLLGGRALGALA